MDQETAKYIIRHFSNLLTEAEKTALRHSTTVEKLQHAAADNAGRTKQYQEKGWLSTDENVLDLLKDGYAAFELKAASTILAQHPDKVFINRCPNCGRLARTPLAQQCRHCGHDWH